MKAVYCLKMLVVVDFLLKRESKAMEFASTESARFAGSDDSWRPYGSRSFLFCAALKRESNDLGHRTGPGRGLPSHALFAKEAWLAGKALEIEPQ